MSIPTEYPCEIAGVVVELVLPGRRSWREDIGCAAAERGAQEQTARRVVAAALGVCWGRASGMPTYSGDVLAYGGDVIDTLFARREVQLKREPNAEEVAKLWNEIIKAGNAALKLISDSLPKPEHHERARGNSEAPKGRDSESSGESSAGGAEIPTG